ncbi:MAG: hypothetical protein DMF87_01830 [Acidobacteria bacterium]|nr:MAG: hypothetical protein DMF87_01830 [Acidobacteriota bacterium]
MARADGPHTRNSLPGAAYRGSKRRVARLSPLDELPANFWLVVAIAVLMLGLSAALIYHAV